MIDTLKRHLTVARFDRVRARFQVTEREYAVLTLHRPSNVDRPDTFRSILAAVREIGRRLPVIFSVHPRTRNRIEEFGLITALDGAILTEPLGYVDFLSVTSHARIVLTDSGGLQEESTALGIPCLTLRENTERPVTVTEGTNRIVGTKTDDIISGFELALSRDWSGYRPPALWDGRTSGRVASTLSRFLGV
jgi:UDP-N-acetylglucosamine 2-epimerase (non-hydrolysing)